MIWRLLQWLKLRRRVTRRERLRSPFRLIVEELENRLVPSTTYAVIGDYGSGDQDEADVANLVNSWNPNYVLTVGDNNYDATLSVTTYDTNVGQFYSDYMYPYTGAYSSTATTNQFFPAIGNHDWNSTVGYQAYLDYFTLPDNERYYKVTLGEVEYFFLNSDTHEPDGRTETSAQADWLQTEMAASTATWQIVVLHHAPYSSAASSSSGGSTDLRWPYQEWGADAVLGGHYHNYERLDINGLAYFVNGIGGVSKASFGTPVSGSQVRYNAAFGAMLVTADDTQVRFQFFNVSGDLIDDYTVALSALPTVTIAATDNNASEEGSEDGVFTITRTGSTDADLVVNYTVSGVAANGVDYDTLSGTATILAGFDSVTVAIDPVDDTLAEGDEDAIVTLASNSAYNLGTAKSDVVTLADNDAIWLVTAGSTWKFLDDGSDQGTAWRDSGFDDSAWASGNAQLGYGDGDEDTVVGFGPDPNNKFITTYFRQTFDVPDPAAISALTLSLLRDDGAVVYLNGVEIFRSNMPSGTITYTTAASTAINGADETTFHEFAVDPGLLVTGSNTLAVEVHQRTANSSDISFDLQLLGALGSLPTVTIAVTDASASEPGTNSGLFTISRTGSTDAELVVNYTWSGSAKNGVDYETLSGTATIASGATSVTLPINPIDDALAEGKENVKVTLSSSSTYTLGAKIAGTVSLADDEATWLVAAGSTWKFLDDGSDQGTAWREAGFDDSAWFSGKAQLGYGDGDEATVVGFGPDANNKYVTTYFRHTFSVSDPAGFSALTLSLLRDDGAVVYLNGVEVFRSNMPSGAITYTTLASSDVSGTNETKFYKINVDPALLVSGTNVLAVELHQAAVTSDDLGFNLKLLGTFQPTVTIAASDANASEVGLDEGVFTITRTGAMSADLIVNYTISGSTANGVDYDTLSGTATILAGSATVTVTVHPVDDALAEGQETVKVTLSANSAYKLGTSKSATVNLTDDEAKWLVAAGSNWKYLDDGSDQGTAWRDSGFNDSSWSSGNAELGYGDGNENKVVGFGPDANNKYITTYFRRTFNVADPSLFSSLNLSLLRDDGAVVYLNGVEVFRSNMPSGDITYTTLASADVSGTEETKFFKITIDPSLLVAGNNVLAVELHQAAASSDDISFNLKLLGVYAA